ncbi:MBL fold metallo-hydrolase [Herbiconiux sp. CPCC 203407]|uniref:MBL fold metallo-hydrolase n=1 Tax=Herbiconiux oxytropis TaxID=2970915 RepID=A0AA41XHS9_9MICO|nr:MBL fold metallo-hydrolase [Herbiconiux oxytropis]MCS5722570.1 MBL fold metallo-hydrolase [Herbiconiux oxytropis]MCS5726510.1 MBL fold metallo-hydrolase [Herbiconiux oxytropis]
MKITRYGHATLLLEEDDTRILVDPGSFSLPEAFALEGLQAVFTTHEHPDHFQPERLGATAARNPGAAFYGAPAVAHALGSIGVPGIPLVEGSPVQVGSFTIDPIGSEHQEVHERMPRIENVGLVVAGGDGTRLFHPGDSYESVPEGIDVLAVPLSSPWGRLGETVDFVTAVAPTTIIPIHDALLSTAGRQLFWSWVPMLVGEGVTALDPEPREAVEFTAGSPVSGVRA